MPMYKFVDEEGHEKYVIACCMAHAVEHWAESERLDLDMEPGETVPEPLHVTKQCEDSQIIERGGMSLQDKIDLHASDQENHDSEG